MVRSIASTVIIDERGNLSMQEFIASDHELWKVSIDRHCQRQKIVEAVYRGSANRLTPPLPAPLSLVQTQAPTSMKSPPFPHGLYDSQDTLDKLMHFVPQLAVRFSFHSCQILSPSKTSCTTKIKIHSSCEIEYFVETHLCKLCVILRSRVLRVVCPH